jgi:transposase
MDTLTMSGKEAPRPGLLKALCDERITNREAAVALHLTVRQVQRLKGRYRAGGAAGLVHRGRGQPSAQRLADPVREQITMLMTTVYVGFNDAHLTEKLREAHGLAVSRPTVRRIRRALGRPATRRRRARPHRQRRPREAAAGSLVQIDGSPFDWLEGRGPAMTLLGAIDDATGQILALHFRPTEDLHGYATLFHQLFTTHGLPLAFYGDRLNVFVRNDRHWTLAEELQGTRHPTHLGRMLQELGIGYIAAHSPQAKGRVERLWQTLQDRLVSELRLRGSRSLAAANAFLPAFSADFNGRFTVPPAAPTAVWRRPPRTLDRMLSCRYAVRVARDHTVTLGPRWVQLPRAPQGQSYAARRVEVRELLDGRLLVFSDDRLLATHAAPPGGFTLKPRRAPSADRRPARAPRPAQSPQDQRSARDPIAEDPSNSPAAAPPSPRAHPRRPPPDHPWNRSIRLHQLRKAQRTRG